MFPSSYSSRHNSQRPMQDRASSSSTSSSWSPQSLDEARSASTSNSSSRYQSVRDDFARSSTFRGIDITRRAAQQDRAPSSSTGSSQNPANQSTTRTDYRTNPAHVELLASIRGGSRYGRMRGNPADYGMPPSSSRSSLSRPALTERNRTPNDYRPIEEAPRPSELFQHTDVPSYFISPTYERATQNAHDTDERSFYQDAASYMASPTYTGAVRTGNSGSMEQLSLARSFIGRGGDSLWGQLDNEYRGQERGPHSPT